MTTAVENTEKEGNLENLECVLTRLANRPCYALRQEGVLEDVDGVVGEDGIRRHGREEDEGASALLGEAAVEREQRVEDAQSDVGPAAVDDRGSLRGGHDVGGNPERDKEGAHPLDHVADGAVGDAQIGVVTVVAVKAGRELGAVFLSGKGISVFSDGWLRG